MKNNKTIIGAAVAGLMLAATASNAQLVPLVAGGPGSLLAPTSYVGPTGALLATTGAIGFSDAGDVGTLDTSVYAGTSGGETFIYAITLTAGDIDGITANGFSGPVLVGSNLALTTGLAAATYNIFGGVDFSAPILAANSPVTVDFEVETAQTGISPGNIAYKDSAGFNIDSLQPLAAVPEASTVIAGMLMILPLGVGAFRALRKERMA